MLSRLFDSKLNLSRKDNIKIKKDISNTVLVFQKIYIPIYEKTCFLGPQTRYGSIQPSQLQKLTITEKPV